MQVLGVVAVSLRVALPPPTRHRLPPADGATRATLQTRQDHVGQVLLEPVEVLPGNRASVGVEHHGLVRCLRALAYVVGGTGRS